MSTHLEPVYCFGGFRLDLGQRVLMRENEMVALTPKLYDTLLLLAENTGLVVSKDDIMSRIWPHTIAEERSLSQNIFLLRRALGDDSKGRHYIETVPQVGYRFLE